ncbi:hypothetical protein A3850_001845 [Lewinella sp. 4G2]|nr:hypothetical protein A3850_001845 [Lewinella sp. 4G2]
MMRSLVEDIILMCVLGVAGLFRREHPVLMMNSYKAPGPAILYAVAWRMLTNLRRFEQLTARRLCWPSSIYGA